MVWLRILDNSLGVGSLGYDLEGILTAARVIVGIGGAITKVAAPALLHEIAHPRLRATFGTIYYGWYHLGGTVSGIVVSEYNDHHDCALTDDSRGPLCPFPRMALAYALPPASLRPSCRLVNPLIRPRIPQMARLQGQVRRGQSDDYQTPREWKGGRPAC